MPKAEAAQASQPFDETNAICGAGRGEAVDRQLIDARVRLVDPGCLDGQDLAEQIAEPGMVDCSHQHRRRAVRQHRGGEAGIAQLPQHRRRLRIGVEGQIELHQPVAQLPIVQRQCLQRKIEGVTGHLPKIGVTALHCAQPRILQLLVAPQLTEKRGRVAQHIGAAPRRRADIEQGAVGVENAGADGARRFGHAAPRAGTLAARFFAFGQRAATPGSTSSIRRRVCARISASPRAAGRRMNFEIPPST